MSHLIRHGNDNVVAVRVDSPYEEIGAVWSLRKLYVFFIHIYLLLISNTPLPGYEDYGINTGIHAGALAVTWVMVKTEFVFRWNPR